MAFRSLFVSFLRVFEKKGFGFHVTSENLCQIKSQLLVLSISSLIFIFSFLRDILIQYAGLSATSWRKRLGS